MRKSWKKVAGLTLLMVGISLFAFVGLVAGQTDRLLDPVQPSDKTIGLETVATGLTAPVWGTFAPGDAGRLFVVDQPGTLWAVDLATGDKSVFLDVSGRLVPLGVFGPGSFDERGFVGAGEFKFGVLVVIKALLRPAGGRVALVAFLIEAPLVFIVAFMAGNTLLWSGYITLLGMTIPTLHTFVFAF